MRDCICREIGLDASARAQRIVLLGLDDATARAQAQCLHEQVIAPKVDWLVQRFNDWLAPLPGFASIVDQYSSLEQMQETQRRYLLSLGVDFEHRQYFNERLRVGRVHYQLGVSHSLYQCAFRKLQQLLISAIPPDMQQDGEAYRALVAFILQITALDLSLATESYCNSRVIGLQHSLDDERGESERWRKKSHTDWLTSLHNHAYSRHLLEQAMQQCTQRQQSLCVLLTDLDQFKRVNDSFGHLVGDEVLRIAAARMLSAARSQDIVGRYGGEEFIFILPDTGVDTALEVAERVRAHLARDVIACGENAVEVTVSIGLAEARAQDTVNVLIERADAALYEAKAAGRNCVRTAFRG